MSVRVSAARRLDGCWMAVMAIACAGVTSCGGPGASESTLTVDPGEIADAALEEFDADGSGDLNASELKTSPGLASAATMADRDGDGGLSREELVARFEAHTASGPVPYGFDVYYRGQPLAGATVELVPAAFYGEALPKAKCTVSDAGYCEPISEGVEQGVWMGIYRVEVRAPNVEIPAKYNTQSELGMEIVQGGHLTRSGMPPRIELR